jgi:MFS family permease
MQASSAYKNYLLTVLLIILAFNFLDRLALGLAMQQIKAELDLTDTQLGFLSGIAFALFYSIVGIPIGRWADRGNRVTIVSLTAALWSVTVALCGMASSFVQLLLIRVGVAVGEAGCVPPSHSLLADYFTRAERPRAAAIYALGAPLSMLVGYFLAGWLNELYGWRIMFMLLGLPGLLLAALAWFTLREPRRERLNEAEEDRSAARSDDPTTSSLVAVWVALWGNATFRHLLIGFSVLYFFAYGILQWQPAFFARSHGLQSGALGTWFALIYGVGGLLGTYWGGAWASRHAANNESLQLKVMAAIFIGTGVLSSCVYLTSDRYVAFGLLAIFSLAFNLTPGPLLATVQTLVPQQMRATAIALIYLFANLIGMGVGPLAAGAMSDAFRPWAGEESLRYALLALSPGYFWVAWHVWRAGRTVAGDLAMLPIDADIAVETSR